MSSEPGLGVAALPAAATFTISPSVVTPAIAGSFAFFEDVAHAAVRRSKRGKSKRSLNWRFMGSNSLFEVPPSFELASAMLTLGGNLH